MQKESIALLKCVNCKNEALEISVNMKVGAEIQEGLIICKSCNAVYSITSGIPRFLRKELKVNLIQSIFKSLSKCWNAT